MANKNNIYTELRILALQKGITHKQIADTSGLMRSNVSRALSGKYNTTINTYIQIADAIGCTIALTEK